ncbi:MAG: hypothetical protein LBE48_01820, partial [Methanomassiliicoccaceae archaeon]|nr:hypothetical protein [Methanomassiliicoccaceae archaeon]
MPSDQYTRIAVADVVASSEIRKVLTVPRNIPRLIRNETAEILTEELLIGYAIREHSKFILRYGLLFTVMHSLRTSSKWNSLKIMAKRNDLMPVLI